MKTLNELNVKDKRVLVRVDLNSVIINGKVQDNPRFKEHAKTISELKRKKAVVVILAHQGRPGKTNFISLKQHAQILSKYVKVKFVDDIIGKKAVKKIHSLKCGEALLLDNVRFLREEFKPGNNKFVKTLASLCDYYVDDAFSNMHRNHSSMISFPRKLPNAIGRSVESELKKLEELKSKTKNAVYVLGGNKPKDVVLLMKHNKVLTTGVLSLLALKAKGYKLGKEDILLKKEINSIKKIKANLRGTMIPVDLAIKINGKRKEISIDELPTKYQILDIGKKTIKEYQKEIRKAKAIFFKGVAGYTQDKNFQLGTKELLKTIAKSSVFSVVAGGSSSDAISKFKINKKGFNHISLGGGALVHYLAGKKLPGLEVIFSKDKKIRQK